MLGGMTILVLGGTGKTGRRLTALLRSAGQDVRAAARSGGDIAFDWDDPSGYGPALAGVDRVYLITPALRLDYAATVAQFLDQAERLGVRHVTLLSARGVEHAPPEIAARAVELDVASRTFTHTILRPAFFTQNVTEGAFAGPVAEQGVLALPAGDGAEAFVDVGDIAAAAAATLTDPAAHAGAAYELTGPQALTHADLAALLTEANARPVRYVDVPRDAWIAAAADAGLPRDYAEMLAALFDGIRAGQGAVPGNGVRAATGRDPRSVKEVLASS